MTVDLNKPFSDMAGKPVADSNMGQTLAQVLSNLNSKDNVLKIWGWCTKLHAGEKLDLDDSDGKLFIRLVSESEVLAIMGKAQILKEIDA